MAKIMNSIADELTREGHAVDLIFQEDVPAFKEFRRAHGFLFSLLMLAPIFRLWKKNGRHDVVAIHSLEGAVYVLLRKFFRSWPPCVIVSYGSDEMRWEVEKEEERLGLRKIRPFSKVFYYHGIIRQARFATQHADHVMVAAKSEIGYYVKTYGMPQEKMTFVPNGVAPGFFIQRDYSRPAVKLLFLGGWEWRKGIRYLAESFSALAEEFPEVTLSLMGIGVSEETVKQSFPEKFHSRLRVVPQVPAEKIPQVYAEHDLFIFPSLFESMSLVVPEAMASGLPVLTTRTCGMQDIIEDGINGVLVPPRDSGLLAEKIRSLLKDPELRARLGKAAQVKAQDLRWTEVARQTLEMYQKLLKEPSSLGLGQSLLLGAAALLRYYPWKGKAWFWLHSQPLLDIPYPYVVKAGFPGGYTLLLNLREFWQRLMLAGCYDSRELWVLKYLLRAGDVFLDVGANVGYYTLAAASKVQSSGQVYAFEPHPVMAAQLRNNCEQNPHLPIQIFETAVADQSGEASFYIPPDNGFQSVEGSLVAHSDFSEKKVPVVTLDQICRKVGPGKIQLAKIDIEGYEARALRGAQGLLSSGKLESLLCEVSDENRQEVFAILSAVDFEQVIDLRTLKPVTLQTLRPGLSNLLWLRGECSRRWQDLGWEKGMI